MLKAVSLAILIFLVSAMYFFPSFTGLFSKTETESIQAQKQQKQEIVLFENNKTLEQNLEEIPKCPETCDDKNPCTKDLCDESTNYTCKHSNLNGDVEDCKGLLEICIKSTCVYGKCSAIKLDECCGNEICEPRETCATCPLDCSCPNQQTSENEPEEENGHVLINEIQVANTEFIELHNPTASDIDLTGWYLSYFSSTKDWNNPYRNWAFPEGTVIKSRKHFLINVYNLTYPTPDWTLLTQEGLPYSSGQLSNINGSVAIFPFNPKNKTVEEAKAGRIDAIGWGNPAHVYEGVATNAPGIGKSLARSGEDTDNNLNDFVIQEVPNPENSST